MIDNEIAGPCTRCSSFPHNSRRLYGNLLPNIGAGPDEGGGPSSTFLPAPTSSQYWPPMPLVGIQGYETDEEDGVSGLYNDPRRSLAWRLRRGMRR